MDSDGDSLLSNDTDSLRSLDTDSLLSPDTDSFRSMDVDPFFYLQDYAKEEYDSAFTKSFNQPSELNADDPLYLVHHRWWSEVYNSLFSDSDKGVLYETSSSYNVNQGIIDIEMRRVDESGDASTSDANYALISEWMFLLALKWYNNLNAVESFLMAGENIEGLSSLHICVSQNSNLLLVKISRKGNNYDAFSNAWAFFCCGHLFHIRDFSGQTTQLFSKEFSKDLGQTDERTLLQVQVYFLSFQTNKENEMPFDQVENVNDSPSAEGNINSYIKKTKMSYMGLAGLCNLGNTCFMNSAIQCLAHTPSFVNYFLADFSKDLNTINPSPMNGKLALAFGHLLRKLWSPLAKAVTPHMFKFKLSSLAPQFSGYLQHDSQEFLAFLLDGLREELKRIKDKPYTEIKDADGCPDEEAAADSVITHTFQGQFKSTLVCPVCNYISVTFNPFMYLNLPIISTRSTTVTIISTDGTFVPRPVTVNVSKSATCKDLQNALSTFLSLSDSETLLIAKIFNHYVRFMSNPAWLIQDDDKLVAYQLPNDFDTSPLVVFAHLSPPSLFATPLVTRLSGIHNMSGVQEKFLQLLRPFLRTDELDDNVNTETEDNALSDSDSEAELSEDFKFHAPELPLFLENRSVMHEPVKDEKIWNVIVTWTNKMFKKYNTNLLDELPEICKKPSGSLYNCIESFLQEEPLGPDNMWGCPNCKEKVRASKKLDLWRLPETLIIHLKRSEFNTYTNMIAKIETFVDFPIEDLDLSPYIIQDEGKVSHKYMLYAIINHIGNSLDSGHYTALIQVGDNRWYKFDDVTVSAAYLIKTSAAYLLFYKRI